MNHWEESKSSFPAAADDSKPMADFIAPDWSPGAVKNYNCRCFVIHLIMHCFIIKHILILQSHIGINYDIQFLSIESGDPAEKSG